MLSIIIIHLVMFTDLEYVNLIHVMQLEVSAIVFSTLLVSAMFIFQDREKCHNLSFRQS